MTVKDVHTDQWRLREMPDEAADGPARPHQVLVRENFAWGKLFSLMHFIDLKAS